MFHLTKPKNILPYVQQILKKTPTLTNKLLFHEGQIREPTHKYRERVSTRILLNCWREAHMLCLDNSWAVLLIVLWVISTVENILHVYTAELKKLDFFLFIMINNVEKPIET